MRHLFHYSLLTAMLLLIVYVAIGPESGAFYHHPLAVIGIGLIGLGLCKQQHEARLAPASNRNDARVFERSVQA